MKALRIVIIAVLSLAVAFVAGGRLTTWDYNIIRVMDVDGYGNLYLLETDANYGEYFLCKVDPQGRLLYRHDISEFDDENGGREYVDLRVNYAGQIFLQSFFYGDGGIEEEDIELYSTEGVYESTLLDVDWRDTPNLPTKPYFRNMTLTDEKINLLCVSGDYFEIYQLQQQGLEEPLFAGQFSIPMELQPFTCVVTSNLQLVITSHTGEIYHMISGDEIIDVTGLVGNRVVPLTPMPDEYGNVYIADVLGRSIVHLDLSTYQSEVIYNANARLDAAGHELMDFKDVRYLREGAFIGHFVSPQGPQFLTFGGESNIWEHFHKGLALRAGITVGLALILFLALYFLLRGILFMIKRWGIAQKIVFSFLPPYIIVMCLLSWWLSAYITDSYEEELYNSLQTGMRLAVMNINGDEFGALDHLKEYGTERYNAQLDEFLNAVDTLQWVMGDTAGGVLCYAYNRERLYTVFDDRAYNYMPIESTVEASVYNRYYQLLYDTYQSRQGEIVTYAITDQEGEWLVALYPLLDSNNLPVGVLELYMDKWYYLDMVRDQALRSILGLLLVSVVCVCVYFFISLKITLRPLKQLRWAVGQVSEGRFDARVHIKSRDEFREIGIAFNMMSDRLKHYIDNLVLLNSSYVKFVPSRLFDLVGRDNVTDVKLNDRASLDLSILYVSFFSIISSASQTMTHEEHFEMINQNFDQVSSTVEGNRGVITRFDGAGMMALFPVAVENALVCAIQLKELLGEYGHRDMRIVVSSGQALVGVAGNEKHQTIATISDEVSEIYLMNNTAERLGIRYLVTANALQKLSGEQEYLYRYIGRYQNLSRGKITDIYEFLDGEDIYSQSLKVQTRQTFEEGVGLFIRGDFFEARKRFVDVLRVNSADALASSYLVLCDNFEVNRPEIWYGCLFLI